MAPDENPVTELFDEYRRAREEGRAVEPDGLLARAGAARKELESRIRVFEQLSHASRDMRKQIENRDRPRSLGRFRIERALGRGGLSKVYLAEDPKLGRTVALKVLDRSFASDAVERQWILNEARSLARLAHPCVVQVFDVGEADGFDFVEMEHVTGPTLAQVLRASRSVSGAADAPSSPTPETLGAARALASIEARVRLLHRLASALAYCHNRGVIHRDVKPDNVVLDRDGTPKLVDFGLAHQDSHEGGGRPAITEAFIGTRAYLAPEQIEGKRTGADPRSDQFSFATLAYEFLALSHPFSGSSDAETEAAVRAASPEPLRRRERSIPRDLETVIHHALRRQPDERYPSMQAFADDLQAFLEHRPISAQPPSVLRKSVLFLQRNRAVAAFTLLAAAGIAAWITTSVVRERMRILDRLALVDPELPIDAVSFFDAARQLTQLRSDAERHDAALLGRLPGTILPRVEATSLAFSKHLNEVFSAIPSDERVDSWHFVFDLDAALSPTFEENREYAELGTVEIPAQAPGVSALLQRMQPPISSCSRVAFRDFLDLEGRSLLRVPEGAYRILYWRGQDEPLIGESDFVIQEGWAPKRTMQWKAPAPDLLAECLRIPRTRLENECPGEESPTDLPAFRILPRPITGAEFQRFREATGWKGTNKFHGSPGSKAWVDLISAERFASWVGGRLPATEEVWMAWMREDLRFEIETSMPDDREGSEWARNLSPLGLNGCQVYPWEFSRDRQPGIWVNPSARGVMPTNNGGDRGVGFRVAFPDDTAGVYLARSRAQPATTSK